MKQALFSLTITLLTFSIGLLCVGSYRALQSNYEDIVLAQDPAFRNDPHLEILLQDELLKIREAIDLYATGEAKGRRPSEYPHSLEDLVQAGYLREIPVDPMTGEKDWQVEKLVCVYGHSWGITNVHSKSMAVSSKGNPYSEW